MSPFGPVGPVEPAGPVSPVEPVEPVEPVGPVEPIEPVGPVGPVSPVGPIGPPAGPVGPIGPVEPVLPKPTIDDAIQLEPSHANTCPSSTVTISTSVKDPLKLSGPITPPPPPPPPPPVPSLTSPVIKSDDFLVTLSVILSVNITSELNNFISPVFVYKNFGEGK